VFVINISDKRWAKYQSDKRYTRFKGCNGKEDLDMDWINERHHFRYNAKDDHKFNVVGCSQSHRGCMKHIQEYKINNAIVIEDDALIDFNRLSELDDIKEFCYIGGWMRGPVLTKQKEWIKPIFNKGVHKIDTAKFVVSNCHGYYFPSWRDTIYMLEDRVCSHQNHPKRRAIDVEFCHKQRAYDLQFIYPAISTLHLSDANEGFTYSKYVLKDNMYHY
tara:strand:- start:450 stop:1103 length:654 start_codon:yes stop_codon:yes gene_type:complete